MAFPHNAAIGILFCIAVGGGCRPEEPAVELSGGVPLAKAPVAPPELSGEQKAAVQTIAAAGGAIEADEAGFPVRIDLASERVFADEPLVRAALRFPNLKALRLTVSSVPNATLAELATLTQLEELLLQDASLDDLELGQLLQAMPALNRLTLRRLAGVTDDALLAVAACPQLEVLALIEMNQVTGAGLEHLTGASRLRSLDLRNCGSLLSNDFQRLSAMEGLEEVKLAGPAVNDQIAGVITGLAKVQSLTIEDAEISAVFLQRLASHAPTARRIHTLAFARCYGVTDEALQPLGEFPSLKTLSLREILVTGAFLVALKNSGTGPLPLQTLIATNAFLDDQAVACLPGVAPNLVRLDLRGNAGLTEGSRQILENLENLKDLKLEGENP